MSRPPVRALPRCFARGLSSAPSFSFTGTSSVFGSAPGLLEMMAQLVVNPVVEKVLEPERPSTATRTAHPPRPGLPAHADPNFHLVDSGPQGRPVMVCGGGSWQNYKMVTRALLWRLYSLRTHLATK